MEESDKQTKSLNMFL